MSNARLTRTNHYLDTFVHTASHDLKAPITNIKGILNALRDTLPAEVQQDPMVAHIMGLLDHTVGRFLLTIDQLTDFSRLQQAGRTAAFVARGGRCARQPGPGRCGRYVVRASWPALCPLVRQFIAGILQGPHQQGT